MKKFLIVLAILLLGGASYWGYQKWGLGSNITSWSFVPSEAILVYEATTPIAIADRLPENALWKTINSLPLTQTLQDRINTLDTLINKGSFRNTFKDTYTLISLHNTASQNFDFLFTIKLDDINKHAFVSKAIAAFEEENYNSSSRTYQGFTINEITTDKHGSFTFILHKNYIVGSFSAVLVEDAIRTLSSTSFDKTIPELAEINKLQQDEGNLYINFTRLNTLIKGFTNESSKLPFAKSAFWDLAISDNQINCSGFTIFSPTDLLSVFDQNPGDNFDMSEIFPLETSWAWHVNISEPKLMGQKTQEFISQNYPAITEKINSSKKLLDLDINYVYELIDQEIGLLALEPSRPNQNDKLFILEMKDMGEALRFFNSIDERSASLKSDTVYTETFGDFEIRQFPVEDFPEMILGAPAQNFGTSFYFQYRNYLVFCNNLLALKNLSITIENENTWSKSLKFRKMLSNGNQSANLSLFGVTPRGWTQLQQIMNNSWRKFSDQNRYALQNIEFASLQFSTVNVGKMYTNLSLQVPNTQTQNNNEIEIIASVELTEDIISKPFFLVNQATKTQRIVIQDSSYFLHQFDTELKNTWSIPIGEKIISDINQIDFFKNGKYQMAFATKSSIHIIDEKGEYLTGFPKSISSEKAIEHFGIIDYNNSKNYRFGIADEKGAVYLTDKNVNELEGWNPLAFDGALIAPPRHYRLGRRDVMVVIQKNGKINLMNRRGQMMPGFPIDLQTDIIGENFVKETNLLSTSSINLVTKTGEVLEINFEGKLLNRDQLYKPDASTYFTLINDQNRDAYVINRVTGSSHEILNETTETLFSKDYFSKAELFIQYYKLGAGNNLVTIVDAKGSYLYVYNLQGNLITRRPLSATTPISLWNNENGILIFRGVDKRLELVKLPI